MKNKKIIKILKRVGVLITTTLLVLLGVIVWANWRIPNVSKEYIYDSPEQIPSQKTALVLGASKNLRGGYPNPYFTNRINAAKELYDAGKIKAFVLSGDNGRHTYNEPEDMCDALVALGVPDSIIYLDYAGFRTLDSVVRMKEIFDQDSFIVVSQQFHNERAIYLGQQYGLTMYGYNAKDLALNRISSRTKTREKLARVKVFVDLLVGKKPKYLGDKIEIK